MGAEDQQSVASRRRRCTSGIAQKLLRWLSYTVMFASVITIICMLTLRIDPTAWGWVFTSFSLLSIASAIVSCISTKGVCFSLNIFLLIASICVQGSMFLLLVTRPGSVLHRFHSRRSDYDGKVVLKVDASMVLWMFCVQVVVLTMACVIHCCEPVYMYEDLEGNIRVRRSRRQARVQQECATKTESETPMKQVEIEEKKKADEEAKEKDKADMELKEKVGDESACENAAV